MLRFLLHRVIHFNSSKVYWIVKPESALVSSQQLFSKQLCPQYCEEYKDISPRTQEIDRIQDESEQVL